MGRKQDMAQQQRNADTKLQREWDNLEDDHGKVLHKDGRRAFNSDKTVTIEVMRVRREEGKPRFIMADMYQILTLESSTVTYSSVVEAVFDHFGEELGISKATHDVEFPRTLKGPPMTTSEELRGQKEVLVFFKNKKLSEKSRRVGTFQGREGQAGTSMAAPFNKRKSTNISPLKLKRPRSEGGVVVIDDDSKRKTETVAKSLAPTFDFKIDGLMELGKMNEAELKYETAQLRQRIHDPATNTFLWTERKTVEIHRGERIGVGAFRIAYKCTIKGDAGFNHQKLYVFKVFQQEEVDKVVANYAKGKVIKSEDDVIRELNEKATQCQRLASILADKFNRKQHFVEGERIRYVSSWFIEIQTETGKEMGSIEEYIPGKFTKYLNNDMMQPANQLGVSDLKEKLYALAHYSLESSIEKFLLTDIQGVWLLLTDPEIATPKNVTYIDGKPEILFGVGNYTKAIHNFKTTHDCNHYCRLINLKPIFDLPTLSSQ